jgi:predicted lipoprotein with Yx(FWY)xxD motif
VATRQHQTLGTILTDGQGRVLYLFTRDEPNTSNCTGNCAQTWPPLRTLGQPTAGSGANASMLGTINRADGGVQVTYNRWPLYYYAPDQQPGDARGQNVGGVWFVVNPQGEAVRS